MSEIGKEGSVPGKAWTYSSRLLPANDELSVLRNDVFQAYQRLQKKANEFIDDIVKGKHDIPDEKLRSISWLTNEMFPFLVDWLIDWLTNLVFSFICWLIVWLMIVWFFDELIGWLIDWLNWKNWSICFFFTLSGNCQQNGDEKTEFFSFLFWQICRLRISSIRHPKRSWTWPSRNPTNGCTRRKCDGRLCDPTTFPTKWIVWRRTGRRKANGSKVVDGDSAILLRGKMLLLGVLKRRKRRPRSTRRKSTPRRDVVNTGKRRTATASSSRTSTANRRRKAVGRAPFGAHCRPLFGNSLDKRGDWRRCFGIWEVTLSGPRCLRK